MNTRHYIGIFLLSLATLLLELTLTRVLSVTLWYHFGFLIISTALLGFGISGVVLTLWRSLRERATLDRTLAALSIAFGVATIIGFWLMQRIPFDPFSEATTWRLIFLMPLYYIVLTTPFFFSGLAIGLLLTRGSQEINRLYAVDLVGAGVGCAAIAAVMPQFGGSGSVAVVATIGLLAATVFGFAQARRLAVTGAVLGLFTIILAFFADQVLPIAVTLNKRHPLLPQQTKRAPLYTAWNTFSRIDVYELPAMPHEGWPDAGFGIIIDNGTAGTGIGDLSGGVRNYLVQSSHYRPLGVAYIGKDHPKVLIIGSGAGPEVLEALYFGASSITAVEINPIINDIVLRRMSEKWGGLFEQPEVQLVTDEGRSFLRRTKERYDVIISVQTVSNSAIASGALSLTENYLFTREAFEDYLDHLTPHGILWITRPPTQVARLFATARDVFERRDLGSPADHLCAFVVPVLPWGPRQPLSAFLFKKSPLTPDDLVAIKERLGVDRVKSASGKRNLPKILYSSVEPQPGSINHSILTAPDLDAFYAAQPLVYSPATDDRPFFNQQRKWSNLWLGSWFATGMTPGAESTLLILLVQSIVIAAGLILLPLAYFAWQGLRATGSWGFLVYFAGLGLGFIMIEITLLQRFTLYLGQPVYTFAVVLACLLVFTGLGSYVASRFSVRSARVFGFITVGILAAITVTAFVTPVVFSHTLGLILPWRISIAVVLLAPLGILLGMPFPTGMRVVDNKAPELFPWAWGVNGFFTVIGSVGAMLLGITFGFMVVLAIAGGCYLAAMIAISRG